jgi:hypothetical protein
METPPGGAAEQASVESVLMDVLLAKDTAGRTSAGIRPSMGINGLPRDRAISNRNGSDDHGGSEREAPPRDPVVLRRKIEGESHPAGREGDRPMNNEKSWDERDPLEYVMNRMENAAQSGDPAGNGYGAARQKLIQGIRSLRAELAEVDAVLARRTALDGIPNRVDKILHAINTAKEADILRAEVDRLKRDLR